MKREHSQTEETNTPQPAEQPVAVNPNPRANENIRVRQEDEPNGRQQDVGSEITDGEAG